MQYFVDHLHIQIINSANDELLQIIKQLRSINFYFLKTKFLQALSVKELVDIKQTKKYTPLHLILGAVMYCRHRLQRK